MRPRSRVEGGFDLNDGPHERRFHLVQTGGVVDELVERPDLSDLSDGSDGSAWHGRHPGLLRLPQLDGERLLVVEVVGGDITTDSRHEHPLRRVERRQTNPPAQDIGRLARGVTDGQHQIGHAVAAGHPTGRRHAKPATVLDRAKDLVNARQPGNRRASHGLDHQSHIRPRGDPFAFGHRRTQPNESLEQPSDGGKVEQLDLEVPVGASGWGNGDGVDRRDPWRRA